MSTLAWLAHDPAERDRMHRILAQFKERDTRDELGLGALRDGLADLLFPGTSTIQTRLRYMLFVPWMYRDFEARGVPSRQIGGEARAFEVRLTTELLGQDPEAEGVFGRRAGGTLARLPSSVYWAGLGTWGIRRAPMYQDQYHQALDGIYVRRRVLRKLEDGDSIADTHSVTWHPKLPKTPANFPQGITFDLSRDEALFVRDCLASRPATQSSLLAWLAQHGQPADAEFVWEHPQWAEFSDQHRAILEHGRKLSQLMFGASILYNRMLAEISDNPNLQDRAERYRALWASWLAEDIPGLGDWNLGDLWQMVMAAGHRPTPATLQFVTTWLELRLAGLASPTLGATARQLIDARERRLKGPRSRLHNRQMLLNWGGDSGLYRLGFRWVSARRLLADLYAGLQREV